MSFLKLNSVTKYYEHSAVLRKLDLEADSGRIIKISGENGVGKSTLLKIISGLLRPDSGEVYIKDINTSSEVSFNLIKKELKIGYLNFNSQLYSHLSVIKNLELCASLNEVDLVYANKLAQSLGVDKYYHYLPSECSSGVIKKIAFIRSCLHRPGLWLLDEPFVHIDNASIQIVKEVIYENVELGSLLILVSHEQSLTETSKLIQEKYILKNGSLQRD